MRELKVRAVTPHDTQDFLRFFDGPAFGDNPGWAGCYCMFYNLPPEAEWENRTRDQNRAAVEQRLASCEQAGVLAYLRDEVVGWCHAAPRASIPYFAEPAVDAPDDTERRQATGAIVCLLVAPAFRRMGVARQLIRAACAGFRSQGLTWAVANPSAGDPASAQGNYHGHLSLYLDLGFRKVESSDGQWFVRPGLRPAKG